MNTSGASDELSELPTTPEYDQTLVNQSDKFPVPPQATTSFYQVIQRKYPTPYQKDYLEEETEVLHEQVYEVP